MTSWNSAWFLVAIWAQSACMATAAPPSDVCNTEASLGTWHDFSLTIPGEAAPDNVLAVRAQCMTNPAKIKFERCDVTFEKEQKSLWSSAVRSYSFLGKSGKRHALACLPFAEPKIVPAFSTEICTTSSKSEIHSKDCNIGESAKVSMNVQFKCNAGNDQIISCKAKDQSDWMEAKSDLTVAYFGGKGKLFAIRCKPYDQPVITSDYARDVCSADKKDKITVDQGSGTVTVYFECNTANNKILKCFPGKRTAEPVEIPEAASGAGGTFDVGAVNNKKFKQITCWKYEKPEVKQCFEPMSFRLKAFEKY